MDTSRVDGVGTPRAHMTSHQSSMDLLVFGPKFVERLVAGQRREDVLELLLERLEGAEREGLVVVLQ